MTMTISAPARSTTTPPSTGTAAPVEPATPVGPRRRHPNRIPIPPLADCCPGHPRGPLDHASAAELVAMTSTVRNWPVTDRGIDRGRNADATRRGAGKILAWLAGFPGEGWQDRWLTARGDHDGWIIGLLPERQRSGPNITRAQAELRTGLTWLLVSGVIRPDYTLFVRLKTPAVFEVFGLVHDAETFARVGGHHGSPCQVEGVTAAPATLTRARITLIKILLHTGKTRLSDLTSADLLEARGWFLASRRTARALPAAWDILMRLGILPTGSSLAEATRLGRPGPAQMVAFYNVANTNVAQIITRYLAERAPAMDFTSLRGLAADLAGRFWADIEAHHPSMADPTRGLALPTDIAQAWKQRLAEQPGLRGARLDDTTRYATLMAVRAFYLDLADWAQTDPSWAGAVAPTPVRRADVAGFDKSRHRVTARIHQRIRERMPKLPALVAAAEDHLRSARALLAAAQATPVGEDFTHHGATYQRRPNALGQRGADAGQDAIVILHHHDTNTRINQSIVENDAFWAWTVIETLRHTGIRIEELLELTQLALISYRLPATGEVVPLLQIVPSKSNEERLLLVSPELADVLAAIITRLRTLTGTATIPLVARYDPFERQTGPPLPHLFQARRNSAVQTVFSYRSVRRLLIATAERAGLTDATGAPLTFTAHDFRRLFVTDAVNNGLPIHIAARLLGHHSVTTTQAYHAVFQDDLIRDYRSFLDRRRAHRPQVEYRQPTDAEWREFEQHFERRKLELGNCGRPYGSPCSHEHACIRCPMLQVDPRQHTRLTEITHNLRDRITEARANGWLGEIEGLQISLNAARAKLAGLTRTSPVPAPKITNLGMPVIPEATR
ncbi:MAG: tyrosine-type recombinase/integrase [Gemmatimonadales bacterium]|jgi:integrase